MRANNRWTDGRRLHCQNVYAQTYSFQLQRVTMLHNDADTKVSLAYWRNYSRRRQSRE